MDLCSSPVLLLLSTSCLLSLSVIRDSAEHKELRRNLEPLKNPGHSSDSSAGSGVAALEEGKRTNRTVDFGHHGDTSSSNGDEGGVKGAAEGGASMWRRAEWAELRLGRKRRRLQVSESSRDGGMWRWAWLKAPWLRPRPPRWSPFLVGTRLCDVTRGGATGRSPHQPMGTVLPANLLSSNNNNTTTATTKTSQASGEKFFFREPAGSLENLSHIFFPKKFQMRPFLT